MIFFVSPWTNYSISDALMDTNPHSVVTKTTGDEKSKKIKCG